MTDCPASERHEIEAAIQRNVLLPALAAYRDPSLLWPRRRDNCSLVSNAGILVAALSVLPLHRASAAELFRYGLTSLWNIFSGLAPDGAWREGLSYWSLAMRYAGLMVAALESTFGCSFGLAESRDLPKRAILHCTPPARSGPRSILATQNSDTIFYRSLGSRIALADPLMVGSWAMAKVGICPLRQFGLAAREPRPRHSPCRPPKSFAAPISPAFAIPGRLNPSRGQSIWPSKAVMCLLRSEELRLPKRSYCTLKRTPEPLSSMGRGIAGWSIWARMTTISPDISITERMDDRAPLVLLPFAGGWPQHAYDPRS